MLLPMIILQNMKQLNQFKVNNSNNIRGLKYVPIFKLLILDKMKLKFKKVADRYVATMPSKIGIYEIEIYTNYDKKFGWSLSLDDTFIDSDYGYRKKDCIVVSKCILESIINKLN